VAHQVKKNGLPHCSRGALKKKRAALGKGNSTPVTTTAVERSNFENFKSGGEHRKPKTVSKERERLQWDGRALRVGRRENPARPPREGVLGD